MIWRKSMKDDYINSYNKYLSDHLENVRKASDWLMKNAVFSLFNDSDRDRVIKKLSSLGENHDKSKYSAEEYEPYAEYFYGDNPKEEDFNKAWHHHIINNPHHWNYWCFVDSIDNTNEIICVDMPVEYIVEMIADWWSFSWKIGDLYKIFDWYESRKDGIVVSLKTRKYIELILDYIKNILDNDKK